MTTTSFAFFMHLFFFESNHQKINLSRFNVHKPWPNGNPLGRKFNMRRLGLEWPNGLSCKCTQVVKNAISILLRELQFSTRIKEKELR